MKVPKLKSVLFELLNEAMFGHRFKIAIGKKVYPALVSSNPAHEYRQEGEYRVTWFDPDTMEPINHIAFGKETLDYILRYKKFPLGIALQYFKLGLPNPRIIAEKKVDKTPVSTSKVNILVGAIDPDDDFVEAKFGGSHADLKVRNNRKGDFRYNEDTNTVYWHEEHPHHYEELVDEYVLGRLEQKVKKHITLDRYRGNKTAYTLYWNEAHGIEEPEQDGIRLPLPSLK